MSGTKTWSVGEVLSASDLNTNFNKLPYATSAFTASGPSTAIASGASALVAIAFPTSRFQVPPIVTLSTSGAFVTPVLNAISAGTVTVALVNNGGSSQPSNSVVIYGFAVQMTAGTAAG
jgi:hypothetical protein